MGELTALGAVCAELPWNQELREPGPGLPIPGALTW